MTWDELKEKFTPTVLLLVGVYLLAAAAAVYSFGPSRAESQRLQAELARQASTETALVNTIAQLPGLEAQKGALTNSVKAAAAQIPTQHDIPEVLRVISSAAEASSVTLERLSHLPVRRDGEGKTWVTLQLGAVGQGELLSFVNHIEKQLPTFQVTTFALGRIDKDALQLVLEGNLYLRNGETAWDVFWEPPEPELPFVSSFAHQSIGLPFAHIQSCSNGGIKVLGIVEAQGLCKALVETQGERQWVTAGDWVGEAYVSDVQPSHLRLSLGSAEVTLRMGE